MLSRLLWPFGAEILQDQWLRYLRDVTLHRITGLFRCCVPLPKLIPSEWVFAKKEKKILPIG